MNYQYRLLKGDTVKINGVPCTLLGEVDLETPVRVVVQRRVDEKEKVNIITLNPIISPPITSGI